MMLVILIKYNYLRPKHLFCFQLNCNVLSFAHQRRENGSNWGRGQRLIVFPSWCFLFLFLLYLEHFCTYLLHALSTCRLLL